MPTIPLQPDAGDPWRLLPFSDAPMGRQLALSEGMLAALDQTGAPALRWYVPRETALVLGNGQNPGVADGETLAADHIALYRRPSGGTAVLVDAALLSLDIALPHSHPLATGDVVRAYEWVGALWAEALRGLGATKARALPVAETRAQPTLAKDDPLRLACYGALSPWEVVVGEQAPRKLVGLCQTRRRYGALYQIGVYLRFDAAALTRLLAPSSAADQAALAGRLAAAAIGLDEAADAQPDAPAVIAAVEGALTRRHGAALIRSNWLPAELDYAARIEGERFQPLV
ncbi:MAG: ligase [Chloroflexota bacterium]|nr:ligase [Chloroflexota bacterium]